MSAQKRSRKPKTKPKGGRPRSRRKHSAPAVQVSTVSPEEAERQRILAVGVDPALVDWRRVAAGIAVDAGAPAAARVAACRLLATHGVGAPVGPVDAIKFDGDGDGTDELSRRALLIMNARGRVQ